MIPKVIHYCWFGGNPKSEVITQCISSWKEQCPDYKIIEWNEQNWDIDRYLFAREAYNAKKWALVSDVARLDILYRFGGVYLDTDVEILVQNPFEQYLMDNQCVMVFANERSIATGLFFAVEKGAQICSRFLESYNNTSFSDITNVAMNKPVIVDLLPELRWNDRTQIIDGCYIMQTGEYNKLMRHYGTRTGNDFLTKTKPVISEYKSTRLKRILRNPVIFEKLESSSIGKKVLPLYTFFAYDFLDCGVRYYFEYSLYKIKKRMRG